MSEGYNCELREEAAVVRKGKYAQLILMHHKQEEDDDI